MSEYGIFHSYVFYILVSIDLYLICLHRNNESHTFLIINTFKSRTMLIFHDIVPGVTLVILLVTCYQITAGKRFSLALLTIEIAQMNCIKS